MEFSLCAVKSPRFYISSVLNAFQHQWNFHSGAAGYKLRRDGVLNAFQHQWNFHRALGMSSRTFQKSVLNAFQHQWNFHYGADQIRGSFWRGLKMSAKRFSASMEFSQHRNLQRLRCRNVLNAFQHQWNFHADKSADSCPNGILC